MDSSTSFTATKLNELLTPVCNFVQKGSHVDSFACDFDLVCKLPSFEAKISRTFASSDPCGGRALDLSPLHYMSLWYSDTERGKLSAAQTPAGISLDEAEIVFQTAAAKSRVQRQSEGE